MTGDGLALLASLALLAAVGGYLFLQWRSDRSRRAAPAGRQAAVSVPGSAAAGGGAPRPEGGAGHAARGNLLAELTEGLDSGRLDAPARIDVPALPPAHELAAARYESDPLEDAGGGLERASFSRGTSSAAAAAGAGVDIRLSSNYGWRVHPITKVWSFHHGLDLAVPMGTPVRAFANGRVSFVGYAGNAGLMIVLRHFNGYQTRYDHLSAAGVVRGQAVARGSEIGNVGTTGRSTAPHLHFEVRRNEQSVDPRSVRPETLETNPARTGQSGGAAELK